MTVGVDQPATPPADGLRPEPRRLTIVVPCYNEAARLDGERFLTFAAAAPGLRFLFVDDGSRDATKRILDELQGRAPDSIGVLSLAANVGKSEAVRRGCLAAFESNPEYVGYWDADLATPLDEIPRFLSVLEGHPTVLLVMGSRVCLLGRAVHRTWTRHYLGRAFATAASVVLQLPVYDTQCGAKVFRVHPATVSVFQESFLSRWLLDVEIIQRLKQRTSVAACRDGVVLYELPLQAWDDVAGSKLSCRQAAGALRDLARVAIQSRRR